MSESHEQRIGVVYALAAFVFWGLVPIYFNSVKQVPASEVLAHRIIWAVPFIALLVYLGRGWPALRTALGSGRVVGTLILSASVVAFNWFIFIYAVATERVIQASLGYFINPLVNVLLGTVLLGEKLRRLQILAILLAAAGTLYQTVGYGEVPWISLALAFSFAFYGFLRKRVAIESVNGLFVETSLLLPLALGFFFYQAARGKACFGSGDWTTTGLLLLAGAVTSVPLVWFTSATRRLPYSTIGVLQYVAPSLQFLVAVAVFHEPFDMTSFLSFLLIWIGLAVFVADSLVLAAKHAAAGPHGRGRSR